LILTNAHVGDDHAPGLAVQYPNEFNDFDSTPTELQILVAPGLDHAAEPRFRAVVVASDGYLDVAVLKITKTAAGAFVGPNDLEGLKEVKLGSSASVKSGDNIRIIGYPASSASRNPTITTGIIASEVQDERLNTNRAWFNETAGSSGGNSGGGVLDSDGRLVSVLTQGQTGPAATPGRSRPIDLARVVIDAAMKGAKYTSALVTPLPRDAAVVSAHVVQAESDAGFTTGCDSNAPAPKVGDEAIGFQVRYEGFTADAHQDALIEVANLDTKTVIGLTDTNSQYPFKWDAEGCVTVSVPLDEALDGAASYRARVLIGPAYNKGRTLLFSSSSNTNNNNDDNNNVTPPPSG
jgi:S1-C subfamily serine protease